ncbi:PQQ-dependent sugar dehydrogenase [Paraglaciecola polaris]|uniref:L-sorbosone dehydrogenase n=1 Tax=Paraglaciecola polaris LMG 21857 TaxID=1129793 RepID=K6Z499_9ALTE|nr:PQQ-dependent sugar dehydrogenase [Paraglaciecola polaris]GAC31056.1 L-sorbosone dehydrogenase [Paraglaciecola polaris LMG 21857]|tara:strand:- start:6678 stop:7793 length:1116 start_codon:yes stop_codon:yes gene_type:complete
MTLRRLILLSFISFPGLADTLPLDKLHLPDGYKIDIYASDVKNARQMALSDNGILFVGSREGGVISAVIDKDHDGKADEVLIIAKDLTMPSGIAIKDGDLYVAQVSQIVKYSEIEKNFRALPAPEVVIDGLPDKKHHGWKYIDFGPDDWLYLPIGAPCNICQTNGGDKFDNPEFASILKYNLKSKERVWVAKGVRNSVGFDWHPQTKQMWFSDNGRDMMGDDIPPCEINRVDDEGAHYGYPYFHAGTIADPEFSVDKNPEDYVAPAFNLGAHVAPLGIHFYHGDMFPESAQNNLFVAEHGSWNRSKKSGYKVMRAVLKDNEIVDYQPFIEGWLQADETSWGRPVALLTMPDGSLLVSDDFANVIYRVTYQK